MPDPENPGQTISANALEKRKRNRVKVPDPQSPGQTISASALYMRKNRTQQADPPQPAISSAQTAQAINHSLVQMPQTPIEMDYGSTYQEQATSEAGNNHDTGSPFADLDLLFQDNLSDFFPELGSRPMTPVGENSTQLPGMYWDGKDYRPVTPPNSWSQRFMNFFKNDDGSYSNPTAPASYPDFRGYNNNR